MTLLYIVAINAILSTSSYAAPDYSKRTELPETPRHLWGTWDESIVACKAEHSITRMAIGIDWIGFYESGGRLMLTTPGGSPDGESLAARYVMAGEGSTWDMELRFRYTKKTPSILYVSYEKNGLEHRYVKCSV